MKKPLVVTHGTIINSTSISFVTRQGECLIEGDAELLLGVLPHCNGINSIEEIANYLERDVNAITDIINLLETNEIIIDSTETYKILHKDTLNESKFKTSINPADISKLKSSVSKSRKPVSKKRDHGIEDILKTRTTTRNFKKCSIDKKPFEKLLKLMYFDDGRATVPSAGAIYPLTFKVIILSAIGEFEPGIYEFRPDTSKLVRISGRINNEKFRYTFGSQDVLQNAQFIICVSSDITKHASKYGNRGYLYSAIEVGHVAQNIQILSNHLGFGVLEYGGFLSGHLEMLLDNESNETVFLSFIIGVKDESDTAMADTSSKTKQLWGLIDKYVGKQKIIKWIDSEELIYKDHVMPRISSLASFEVKENNINRTGFAYATGYSSLDSTIKAIAEAVERATSSCFHYDIVGSFQNLNSKFDVIRPDELSPINSKWYELPNVVENYSSFSINKSYQWVSGTKLNTGTKSYALVEQVYYPLAAKHLNRKPVLKSNSNGVAAHFDRDQARERALLELIERDAISMLWYTKKPLREIPLDLLGADFYERTRYWHDEDKAEIKFFDISTDSVPVVLCMIRRNNYPHLVVGAAASYNHITVAMKALDELESTLISWVKEPREKIKDPRMIKSPHEHGLYYAYPDSHKYIDWMFANNNEVITRLDVVDLDFNDLVKKYEPTEFIINQPVDQNDLWVIRLMTPSLAPINFGYGCEPTEHKRIKNSAYGMRWAKTPPLHFFP